MMIPVSGRSPRTTLQTSSPWTPGKIAIEHHHVIADDPGLQQRLVAIGRDVDRHPLAAQASGDRVGEASFVFGNSTRISSQHEGRRIRTL